LKDFPHAADTPYLLTQVQILEYLKQYTDHYELKNHIKFKTMVTSIAKSVEGLDKFVVKHIPTDLSDNPSEEVSNFDYVLVCNGHLSYPKSPDYKGKESFKGTQMHIHNLRNLAPKDFNDKNILIVGNSSSASDMLKHLFKLDDPNMAINTSFSWTEANIKPKKVFMSGRSMGKITSKAYEVQQNSGELTFIYGDVDSISGNNVVFNTGIEEHIDTILYCTGYKNCLPFLDPKDDFVSFEDGSDRGMKLNGLYKEIFCINDPKLLFVGSHSKFIPIIPTSERQALIVKQYIQGELELPSKEDMHKNMVEENEYDMGEGSFGGKYKRREYSFTKYHDDLKLMSNLPADTKNNEELWALFEDRLIELFEQGNLSMRKYINFASMFEGTECNPTSAKL
jgi:hypothetical protein